MKIIGNNWIPVALEARIREAEREEQQIEREWLYRVQSERYAEAERQRTELADAWIKVRR